MTFHSGEMRGLARRRLRYAIVTSLLLHLLLLWSGASPVLTKDTPSTLHATLNRQAAPKPAPAKLLRAVSPAPTFAPPMPKSASLDLEPQKPPSVPQTPVIAPEARANSSPGPASSAPTAAAMPVPATTGGLEGGSQVTEADASGEVIDGLRGYRLALAIQARRFKRYPVQAIASGWVGSADIRVEVGSDGRARVATLVRSSGHEPLDSAALAMINAGAPRAHLPESLRGKAFAVVLPVVFNLADE